MYSWQQQPEESDTWFTKFQTYFLQQGPGATLLEAENRYRDRKGRKRTDSNSSAWRKASKDLNWSGRADDYWKAHGEESVEETAQAVSVQQEAINQGRTALSDAATEAIETLKDIAKDKGAPSSARVAAANSILDRVGIIKCSPEAEEAPKPPPTWDLSNLTSDQLRAFIELAGLAQRPAPT